MMVKVGLIGLGGISDFHREAFSKIRGCRIVAGCDPSEEARNRFAVHLPNAAVYADYRQMLDEGEVDAVVVSAPTRLHKDIAIDVMRSGRPVLVEKPMARTVSDARRMLKAAEETGQLLMVAHCRRYDANWGRFAKIYQDGQLGQPVLWRHVMAGLGPGRWFMDADMGGGPLMDGAVHNYDFANYLFGEPESVIGSSIKLTDRSAVDTATAVVRYKSGDQLMVSWSWGTRGDSAHDVLGPGGTMLFGPGHMKPKDDPAGYAYHRVWPAGRKEPKLVRFKCDVYAMYTHQARHFIDCVTGREPVCRSSGSEAIKAVAVAEAVLKAAEKGGVSRVKW